MVVFKDMLLLFCVLGVSSSLIMILMLYDIMQ